MKNKQRVFSKNYPLIENLLFVFAIVKFVNSTNGYSAFDRSYNRGTRFHLTF